MALQTVDRAEFSRLVEHEGPKIVAFARRACGDGSDAEDIAQETFLRAFRSFDQLEDSGHARAWLFTIARRVCQRLHRKKSGEPRHFESLEPLTELWPRPGATVPDALSLVDEAFDSRTRSEARERVEAAISNLPQPFRAVLVLADVAELSTPEIAAVLGLKEATVKTRIHRARLRVRAALAEALPQRPAPKPGHARQVCLDLLRAKLEAMDRRAHFPFTDQALCERCRIQLGLLDFAGSVCASLREPTALAELRRRLDSQLDPTNAEPIKPRERTKPQARA